MVAHAAFGIRQNLDAIRIKRVEARVRQHRPVGRLKIVQAVDLLFGFEMAGGFGRGLQALKEIAQAILQMAFELGATAAEQVAQIAVETGKCQSLAKAACLATSNLFAWRVLHQKSSQKPTRAESSA